MRIGACALYVLTVRHRNFITISSLSPTGARLCTTSLLLKCAATLRRVASRPNSFSDFTCALSVRTRMVRTFVSLLRPHYVPHAPRAKPLRSLHHTPACSTARWPRNRMVASVLGGRPCSRRDSCATRLPRQLCLIASYVFRVPAAALHQPSLDLSAVRSLSVLMRGSARCAMKSLS